MVRKFFDKMLSRFPPGTFDRIAAVLGPTEDRSDFVRAAVEQELKRREQQATGRKASTRREAAAWPRVLRDG
jgi:hypothetical protein